MRLDHLLSRVKPKKEKVIEKDFVEDLGKRVKHYTVLKVRKHFQKGKSGSRGDVAQLGERLPCTQEAIGSNPFISTTGS